jgi:hypothetical protein
MTFKHPISEKTVRPPCLKNWLFPLQGLIYLTPKLLQANFIHFAPRCFNQDPVENFFSSIRSHGVRIINPTCASFISSCKSLLINNFVSHHSVGANCEEDDSEGSLDNLRSFIEQRTITHVQPYMQPLQLSVIEESPISSNFIARYTTAYVAMLGANC